MKEDFFNEYRCNCGKLLFKGSGLSGKIEIKCKRCGTIKSIIGEVKRLLLRDTDASAYGSVGAIGEVVPEIAE